MDEDIELKLIKQIENHEEDFENFRQKKLANLDTRSFEEIFCSTFYYRLKKIQYDNGKTLEEYFEEDANIEDIPIDCVLNDNIKKNNNLIARIINTNFNNSFNELSQISDKITIEQKYIHVFLVSYDSTVYIVETNPSRVNKIGSTSESFRAQRNSVDVKQHVLVNLSKYKDFESASLHNSHPYNADNEYYNTVKCNKKCSDVYKEIYKNITNHAKYGETQMGGKAVSYNSNTPYTIYDVKGSSSKDWTGFFLSKIKFYALNMKHAILPIYKIRFHKPGFDTHFIINAQTKQCIQSK